MTAIVRLICLVSLVAQVPATKPVVGFIVSCKPGVRLVRGTRSAPLDERFIWLPVRLDDRLKVAAGSRAELTIDVGSRRGASATITRDQQLNRTFLGQLEATVLTGPAPEVIWSKGSLGKRSAHLVLPSRVRVIAYDSANVPALHWVSGDQVKLVRVRLLDANGSEAWKSGWWPAGAGSQRAEEMFRIMRSHANATRDCLMKLAFDTDTGQCTMYQLRVEPTSVKGEAVPRFMMKARGPMDLAAVLSGPDGYATKRHYIEASDYFIRNHKRFPKSQTVVAIGLHYAQHADVTGLNEYLDRYRDDVILTSWLDHGAVDGLWLRYPETGP